MFDINKKEKKEELDNFIKKIDDIEFIPDKLLKDMDFYQLAYYVQTLNNVENTFIEKENNKEEKGE